MEATELSGTVLGSGINRKIRSRSGCSSCRQTRIKCDEVHPVCGRCKEKATLCEWPSSSKPESGRKKHRNPRNISSCDSCRHRKLRCGGVTGQTCGSCQHRGIACRWTLRASGSPSSGERRSQSPLSAQKETKYDFPSWNNMSTIAEAPLFTQPNLTIPYPQISPQVVTAFHPLLIQPGEISNVKELVRLYFSTVHNFGYLSFVHEADYWERFEHNRAPEVLTLLMAASALRFGSTFREATSLAVADRWASLAGDRMLSLITNEFGAIELMEVVLCHHYDFLRGRYQRGWIMAGMAVRMMTFLRLHILDESSYPTFKPLLGVESLRRLAWAVWWLDATIDGGNAGFSTICDGALTIQLPCDDRPFLLHQHVKTESLDPPATPSSSSVLGLSAHLLRAMYARQILADLYSRIKRNLVDVSLLQRLVPQAESHARRLLDTLPLELAYSRMQYHAYKDQQPMLVGLHLLRNTCLRHIALLRILAAPHLTNGLEDIPRQREKMIQDTRSLSVLLGDAIHFKVVMEPQAAMHAYNGIEVLLFQPMRQSLEGLNVTIGRQEILQLLKPLIHVIRDLAQVCTLVDLIYPEAINRMVKLGYVDDLTNEDVVAVLKKIHCLANADSEFDFQESFWRYELSLARQQGVEHIVESPTDALLELRSETSPESRPPTHAANLDLNPDPITRLQSLFSSSSRPTPSVNPFDLQSQGMNDSGSTNTMIDDPLFGMASEDLQNLLNTYASPDPAPFPFAWAFSDGSRHV